MLKLTSKQDFTPPSFCVSIEGKDSFGQIFKHGIILKYSNQNLTPKELADWFDKALSQVLVYIYKTYGVVDTSGAIEDFRDKAVDEFTTIYIRYKRDSINSQIAKLSSKLLQADAQELLEIKKQLKELQSQYVKIGVE